MRAPSLFATLALLCPTATLQAQDAAAAQPLFPALAHCQQPQLAVGKDGSLALVFVVDGSAIQLSLRPKGKPWQPPLQVASVPQLACGMHRGPRVAFAGTTLLVSYIEARFDAVKKQGLGSGNLLLRRSTDGRTWSPPLAINSEPGSAREGLQALAARGDQVVLTWLDPRGEPRGARLYAALSTDGGRSFGADFAAYQSPDGPICPCCHPSAGIGADGRVVLMWRNALAGNRDIFVGTLAGNGMTDAAAAGRGHWQLAACPMDGGSLAVTGNGQAFSIWRRENEIFCALGSGRELRLGPGRNPGIAVAGERAMAVWEQDGQIVAQPLPVPPTAELTASRPLGKGSYAAVAALPDGDFAVVAEQRHEGGVRLVSWDCKGR